MSALNDTGQKFDLVKTAIIQELLLVSPENRDDNWVTAFREHIWNAAMEVLEPQVIIGPGKFTYLNLTIPEEGKKFQSFSLAEVADHCVNSGLGVAIFSSENAFKEEKPDFVMPLGLVDSLLRHQSWEGKFLPQNVALEAGMNVEQIEEEKNVMVGVPSEDMLPLYTRHYLGQIMRRFGIEKPKLAAVYDEELGHSIAVNCRDENFGGKDEIEYFCYVMSWYLTPGIGIMPLPQDWDESALIDI